jgi:hypothetical protein
MCVLWQFVIAGRTCVGMSTQQQISRPWDRKGIGRFETSTSSPPVSSIQVDGVVFKSDRFYLNRSVDDPPVMLPSGCSCGARSPPPLLDVKRLVASLDLKAAILATYTLDLKYMQRELLSLFAPQSVVPTLVLHGHKGLSERMKRAAKKKTATNSNGKINNYSPDERHSKRPRVDHKTDEDITYIYDSSDEEGVSSAAYKVLETEDEGRMSIKEEEPPEEALLRKLDEAAVYDDISLGPCVHLTEILPAWVPEQARREIETRQKATKSDENEVIVLDSDGEETHAETRGSLDPLVVQRRKVKVGVHHPKFMILFETSGSVVVVVSTSNLTPQHAVDASWVQRFEPSQVDKRKSEIDDAMRGNGSDFGHVLANYLECQSNAAREDQMLPEAFLSKYVGITTLERFSSLYRFEDSQVHLIATVPGNYKGHERATHLRDSRGSKPFLYGAQRVNDILHRLSGSTSLGPQVKPWLPRSFLSGEDRLIIQPTSFGGNWKQGNFAELIRLYFEHGITDRSDVSCGRTEHFLGQTDILWPSLDYMNEINQNGSQVRVPSPDSVSNAVFANDTIATASGKPIGSFLFLSSIAFNTIDLACLSRMSMFEPSTPSQMITNRPPHIKSFARVFQGNEYQLRKEYGVEKAEECLSWFMLTSACLSRGAQGEATPLRGFESDEMTYSNFELGVLFVSRLQGNKQSDRLYCWKPSQCHDNQAQKSSVEMIHLPIPYCIRARSYHADDEEAEMCATPYFHEIPPGTGFVGQMRLTPLGIKLAAAQL